MDILWWMDASGLLDERYNEIPDLVRAGRLPSIQLVGSSERKTLDLNVLRRFGVRLVGRLAGIRDGAAQFSGSLANVSTLADLKAPTAARHVRPVGNRSRCGRPRRSGT